jgi:hypothetical protein
MQRLALHLFSRFYVLIAIVIAILDVGVTIKIDQLKLSTSILLGISHATPKPKLQ